MQSARESRDHVDSGVVLSDAAFVPASGDAVGRPPSPHTFTADDRAAVPMDTVTTAAESRRQQEQQLLQQQQQLLQLFNIDNDGDTYV